MVTMQVGFQFPNMTNKVREKKRVDLVFLFDLFYILYNFIKS